MKIIKNFDQFLNEDIDNNPNGDTNSNENLYPHNDKIDYTNLTYQGPAEEIINLCQKADEYGVKSVCIRPDKVALATKELCNSDVLVCTVVSFPQMKGKTEDSGTMTTEQKIAETEKVISYGADEVDMVFNWQMLKDKWNDGEIDQETYGYLVNDVSSLADICHENTNKEGNEIILKVIVESGMLTVEQTKICTEICIDADADFIKTSTGMVTVGAEVNKINAMREVISEESSDLKIKASGGINKSNVDTLEPLVQRLGMGYTAVDELNRLGVNKSNY